MAKSYNNIGNVYNSQGKYEEALKVYTKSLDIKTRIYGGDNHPDVAKSYVGLGNVYNRQGQYERALEDYQKALEIDIKVSGQDSPDVAASYNNIGMVYDSQGKYEEALEMHSKLEACMKREHILSGSLWPPSHVHTQ